MKWEEHQNAIQELRKKGFSCGLLKPVVAAVKHLGDLDKQVRYLMGEVIREAHKPTHKFEVGDEVVTKCDGATDNSEIKKGAVGTVWGQDGDVIVDFPPHCHVYCRPDQLELVPDEPKQKFWAGDLVQAEEDRAVATCGICGMLGFKKDMASMRNLPKGSWWANHGYAHPECLPGTDYDRRKEER